MSPTDTLMSPASPISQLKETIRRKKAHADDMSDSLTKNLKVEDVTDL